MSIREHYSGKLVYAAKAGGEETRVDWWGSIDFIGINAFYPINQSATVEGMKESWQQIIEKVKQLLLETSS